MRAPLAFWCSGGDLIAGQDASGAPISIADARALWGLYLDEVRAALAAGDRSAEVRAARLAVQLLRAVKARQRWRRASSGLR
jgi:hypothetical protein